MSEKSYKPVELPMTCSKYLEESKRTNTTWPNEVPFDDHKMQLLHATFGLVTESGEFADALKRHIFYGAPIDYRNLTEELGDIMWYMAIALRELGVDFETVMEKNINKLKVRYPEKFNQQCALFRDIDKEKEALDED